MRPLLTAALLLAFSGCGYVGPPQPPALNIPKPVDDLSVSEIGDRIVARFTPPSQTTENLPAALRPYEAKVCTAAAAVARIKPGQQVFIGTACATPRELVAALRAPEVVKLYDAGGVIAVSSTPEAFRDELTESLAKWRGLMKELKLGE